uniref:UvrD-like helicase C-terminal domain-containing protein n=1 Tax=viral metagenome TaxID=1070528 RepID=A0A6C0HM44_9ZZZZ
MDKHIFEFIPNDEQIICLETVKQFITTNKPFSRLLINGSAGTGKTSIIISGIVTYMITHITPNIKAIVKAINCQKWSTLDTLPNFIIAAPTNKAKDVLIAKYDNLIGRLFIDETTGYVADYNHVIKIALKRKIIFLTVSQVLGISRTINELGEEEFTKGNDLKIIKKYNNVIYAESRIIIDECSMIDSNVYKLLTMIKCSIIYIGDYCQLPPVNEIISPAFALENNDDVSSTDNVNTIVIKLSKVERCTNEITKIANSLRDRIYNLTPNFNLLKMAINVNEVIQYKKDFNKWIKAYCATITNQITHQITNQITNTETDNTTNTLHKHDNMALAWTNKCCGLINRKIREMLYIDQDIDTEEHFIIKGDKLFVKNNYFKYFSKINPSTIVYVSKFTKVAYKPLSFANWLATITKLNEQVNLKKSKKQNDAGIKADSIADSIADTTGKNQIAINLDNILDNILEITLQSSQYLVLDNASIINAATPNATHKATINDFFPIIGITDNIIDQQNDPQITAQRNEHAIYKLQLEQLKQLQSQFYIIHDLANVILEDIYEFTDIVSATYANAISIATIYTIKNLPANVKQIAYTEWHKAVSISLFGIPIDKIHCKKCAFFATKFASSRYADTCFIKDMIDATANLSVAIYLCDLSTYDMQGGKTYRNIPVLDQLNSANSVLQTLKAIIKDSFEIKIVLTKQEATALYKINVEMGDDANTQEGANTTPLEDGNHSNHTKSNMYISMSQMLGHYFSHVFSSSYLDVDYGYALTVHKSQGSTYNDVYMEYGNICINSKDSERHKLLYTALTRCSNNLHVYY